MPTNVYNKCIKCLAEHKGKELTLEELKSLIMIHLGSQQITIDTALRTMSLTGLIKDIGDFRFNVV